MWILFWGGFRQRDHTVPGTFSRRAGGVLNAASVKPALKCCRSIKQHLGYHEKWRPLSLSRSHQLLSFFHFAKLKIFFLTQQQIYRLLEQHK